MMGASTLPVLAACALSLAGLAAVWRAWARDIVGAPLAAMLGLALVCWSASTWLWIGRFGAEIGTALAIETASLLAFGFMLSRMKRQSSRNVDANRVDARAATETEAQPDAGQRYRRWRVAARTAVAGPLALAAALSLGLMVGLRAPLHEQTRLIIGGLAVPTLWALMIILTLALPRIWPTALAFVFAVLAAGALAWFGL